MVASIQDVVAGASDEKAVLSTATDRQHVVSGPAVETIASGTTVQSIVAFATVHLIDSGIPNQSVIACAAMLHQAFLRDLSPAKR